MSDIIENIDSSDPAPAIEPEGFVAGERIISAYCPFHLGDHVYNFYLFNHLYQTGFLESTNSYINYYFPEIYHEQVREFNQCPNRIRIFDFPEKDDYSGDKYGYRMHTHNESLPLHMNNCRHRNFDQYYVEFFNQFLRLWVNPGAPMPAPLFQKFEYVDEELPVRYENLPAAYKDIDILIVNSTPRSLQYNLNKRDWNRYIQGLVHIANFRVATTEKVPDVLCTMDANLTVKDIAAMSTHAKVIIGISTGPLSGCFNKYTLENMRAMYVFQNDNTYITPRVEKRKFIWDIKIQDLYRLCRQDPSSFGSGGGAIHLTRELVLFDKMVTKESAAAAAALAAREKEIMRIRREQASSEGLINKWFRGFAERNKVERRKIEILRSVTK